MFRSLASLVTAFFLAVTMYAQVASVCTVRFAGDVSIQTPQRNYGMVSVLVKPTGLPLQSYDANEVRYVGSVDLQHGEMDPAILVHDGLGIGCEYVGTASRDGRGTMIVTINTTGSSPTAVVELIVEKDPLEGLVATCDGDVRTDWTDHWIKQYRTSFETSKGIFEYPGLTQQGEWMTAVVRKRIQGVFDNESRTIESVTTVDMQLGGSPIVKLAPVRIGPLIPGVPVPLMWVATALYGDETIRMKSATLNVGNRTIEMTRSGDQNFVAHDVDVVGDATWEDENVPVSVRAELSDGTVLEAIYVQELIRRPFWLDEGAVFTVVPGDAWQNYVNYSLKDGIRGGDAVLNMRKSDITCYFLDRVHPVFTPSIGFGGIKLGTTSGSFYNDVDWDTRSNEIQRNVFTLSMQLPDRVEFDIPVTTLFRVDDGRLDMAYTTGLNPRVKGTSKVVRTMGSLFGSMLDRLHSAATQEELLVIDTTRVVMEYDGALTLFSLVRFDRLDIDLLKAGPHPQFDLMMDLKAEQSTDINDYLTVHASTKGHLIWIGVLGDTVESHIVGGTSRQVLITDLFGDLTVVADETAKVWREPIPIVQQPGGGTIPTAMVAESNTRNIAAIDQRAGARPVIAGGGGKRGMVWAGRNGRHPVITVATMDDMSQNIRTLDFGSSQPFVHGPSAAFDGQGRMVVVWESAASAVPTNAPVNIAAFIADIVLRWAVIDVKHNIVLDSGVFAGASALHPQLRATADGAVHVFWKATRGSLSSIVHAVWGGNVWSTPRSVVSDVPDMGMWNAAVDKPSTALVTWMAGQDAYSATTDGKESEIVFHGTAQGILPLLTADDHSWVVLRSNGLISILPHDRAFHIQFGHDELGPSFARGEARMDGSSLLIGAVRSDGFVVVRHEGAKTTVLTEDLPPMGEYVRWGSARWAADGTLDYCMTTVGDNTVVDDRATILFGRAFMDRTTSVDRTVQTGAPGGFCASPGRSLDFISSSGAYQWYDVMGRSIYRMDVVDGTVPVCPGLVQGIYLVRGPGYNGSVFIR